mmetsp:Transcript_24422/g.68477  ORF Transcript_24422/g.68477 Transcript_24422/m.68477 type:complete len:251 (-) Transcript_24422:229-981(-)
MATDQFGMRTGRGLHKPEICDQTHAVPRTPGAPPRAHPGTPPGSSHSHVPLSRTAGSPPGGHHEPYTLPPHDLWTGTGSTMIRDRRLAGGIGIRHKQPDATFLHEGAWWSVDVIHGSPWTGSMMPDNVTAKAIRRDALKEPTDNQLPLDGSSGPTAAASILRAQKFRQYMGRYPRYNDFKRTEAQAERNVLPEKLPLQNQISRTYLRIQPPPSTYKVLPRCYPSQGMGKRTNGCQKRTLSCPFLPIHFHL